MARKVKHIPATVKLAHNAGGMGTSPYEATKHMSRSHSPRKLRQLERRSTKRNLKRGVWD